MGFRAGTSYTAFGEMDVQDGSTENSYLYTGEQFDGELGQYYLRARYRSKRKCFFVEHFNINDGLINWL